MSARFLICLAISPVQRFIREARKAQDIWSASLLLSHFALKIVHELKTRNAQIIFPWLGDNPPADRPSVTNEIVASFDGSEDDAEDAAKGAAKEARLWWKDHVASGVKEKLKPLFDGNDLQLWDEQIDAQFRIVWAVAPLEESEAARSYEQLQLLLAAAKQSRTVKRYCGDHRFKCTLSGDFEQMGAADKFWAEEFPERLRGCPEINLRLLRTLSRFDTQ